MVDRHLLQNLCRLASGPIQSGFQKEMKIRDKGGGDPVTETDIRISEMVSDALVEAGFSAEQVISEENENRILTSDEFWLMDPLDGTREFVAGIPELAFSIAYIKKGKVIAAAVFNPLKGHGAIATVSDGIEWIGSKEAYSEILCSRSEHKEGLLEGFGKIRPVRPIGSVAYKLALVAGGVSPGTVSYRPKSGWDIAAGSFLVEQAGGKMTDGTGASLEFLDPFQRYTRGLVAAGKGRDHQKLLEDFEKYDVQAF